MKEVGDHLSEIAQVACAEVRANGFDYPVRAEITHMYFTTRRYGDYTLPAGMYDALRISIGKAEGHNWWCVMYPSLCLSSASERESRAKQAYSDEFTDEELLQLKREYAPLLDEVSELYDSFLISNEYLDDLGLREFIRQRKFLNHIQSQNNALHKQQ